MTSQASISYSIAFPRANAHYVTVTISGQVDAGKHTLIMPVWTPGSYKVREFSQHVDGFNADLDGADMPVLRADKNTWEVTTSKAGNLRFTYEVYAFELGVRTSYVDATKAFVHGVSAFMYWKGREAESILLDVSNPSSWNDVFVSLPKEGNSWKAANFDLLADSPIACGTFDSVTYESGGCPHTVVMIGKGSYQLDTIARDFKTISDIEVNLFDGVHPSSQYIHFIQNVDQGGGGLEHLNCQTSQVNRWAYSDEKKYRSFLGLVAHEYFHLWNVKRIRPIELGPFDYTTENYTDQLWVAEGITSYYDDLFLKRAGFHTEESYLDVVSSSINRLENMSGRNVMTLDEASKLAWIKAYLPNENSQNVTISYYNKGMLVAWLLDLKIMEMTHGKKRLDDVMRLLYSNWKKNDVGFTVDEFEQACSSVAGKSLTAFFNTYVRSTTPLPYDQMAKYLGLELKNKADVQSAFLGMRIKVEGGKSIVSFVQSEGPALFAGMQVNDEIIAFDGWRVQGDLTDEINRMKPEKEVEVIYSRDGEMRRCKLTPIPNQTVEYQLKRLENPSKVQAEAYQKWLEN